MSFTFPRTYTRVVIETTSTGSTGNPFVLTAKSGTKTPRLHSYSVCVASTATTITIQSVTTGGTVNVSGPMSVNRGPLGKEFTAHIEGALVGQSAGNLQMASTANVNGWAIISSS